jgi:hypothetical protein
MHAGPAARRALESSDMLVLPMRKRVVTQYATNDEGARELRLFHGDREISFDEPELFSFGETMARQDRFVAGIATTWGEGLEWSRIRSLLETLLDEGVLRYADEWVGDERIMGENGMRPSPLPPAPAGRPRTWLESETVAAELGVRPFETGYLELVIPIFRVVHMALDADHRQVGEANVFPPQMRVEAPTRWRTCIYEGTRFQSAKPMNVTALKSMRTHWGQMMAALLKIRAAYLVRFPEARTGWTIGHLERLSVCVLALPTWLMMRSENRVPNGALHPALSSLFRVTDGLRQTMHQMLFVPFGEPARSPDTPMTSAEVYAYAERNYAFHSAHGVCAGPKVMVEEFFSVLIDGREPRAGLPAELDPQVAAALDDLDPVLDYGLLGLQAYAATFSTWPIMARTYEQLAGIASAWARTGGPAVRALRDRLQANVDLIRGVAYLATEERRTDRERVYADMYAHCGRGVIGCVPRPGLPERLAVTPLGRGGAAAHNLRVLVSRHVGGADAGTPHLEAMVGTVTGFLRQVQAILRAADDVQRSINRRLGRAQPGRPFAAADLDIHNRMRPDGGTRAAYLVDALESIFGIYITLDRDHLSIEPQDIALARITTAMAKDSDGMGPAG